MQEKPVYILAIESSCDDTGAAVLCNNKVLSNVIAGQEIHAKYGGVVPELASRAHQQNIVPVVAQAIKESGISKNQLDAIAFTQGPGLMGSLLVGVSFAKSLAMALNIPLLAINHMQAHVLAHFIEYENSKIPTFSFLCLTISGGHTQIVKLTDYFSFEILGQTIDDAVGEAFDKSAKILGLDYPGGPFVDKYAQFGNPLSFKFPYPKTKNPLDFSFSGLKTAVLYFIQKKVKENPDFITQNRDDICASIQHTIINILMTKLELAVTQTGIKQVAIAGGVSANSGIRKALQQAETDLGWQCFVPKFEYTTDNAAMIGIAGYYAYLQNNFAANDSVAKARMTL
ncbi:MAG: tRNA (adenosine(37)-N6)-threonylcarbamoyltransferase complex transferase subunit TsaD [Flavobacteriales bacterium]|nr:tRNA (adenosine(37)-N6)-threonylcarbamoyltransferase complex transferase subunit TsaD [Flavobacteriales bacterium]